MSTSVQNAASPLQKVGGRLSLRVDLAYFHTVSLKPSLSRCGLGS